MSLIGAFSIALLVAGPAVAPDEGPARVTGVVLDARGRPFAGARVTWMRSDDGTFDVFDAPLPSGGEKRFVRTDQEGRFVLYAPSGRIAVVAVRGGDVIHVRLTPVDLTRRGAEVTVRFDGTASIRGRVLDQDGRPVPQVRVTVIPERTGAAARRGDAIIARGWSGADGWFEFDGLAPGEHRLLARGAGHVCNEPCEYRDGMRVRVGAESAVNVPLDPMGSISGRVLRRDPAGRLQPVKRFVVSSQAFGREEIDGQDGIFSVDLPRLYQGAPLRIDAPGLAPYVTKFDLLQPVAVDLGDIVLSTGRVVRGHVRDAAGAPVNGASVAVGVAMDGLERRSVKTGGDGAFELPGVPDEARLVVIHPSFQSLELVADASSNDLDVRLTPAMVLRLRVVDAGGKPLRGTRVWSVMSGSLCQTGADGECVLTGVEPREHIVEVAAPGRPPTQQLRIPLEAVRAGPVTVRVASEPAMLTVVATSADGTFAEADVKVIPGEIELEHLNGPLDVPYYATGIDLEKRLQNLPPGRYTLLVRGPGRCAAPVADVPAGTSRMVVKLPAELGPCTR
jgi:protocatechuate 3,4-dioxygenase beta subunit